MKKFIFLILIISACGQNNSTADYKDSSQKILLPVDSSNSKNLKDIITNADSTEKANNESVVVSGDNINKAFVFLKDGDSTINLTSNIRLDHRIFGYAEPDVHSERLLLLSVFTNDVENNPFHCRFGAYYDTRGMHDLSLKYVSITDNFVRATVIDKSNNHTTIYFEKKWIDIE